MYEQKNKEFLVFMFSGAMVASFVHCWAYTYFDVINDTAALFTWLGSIVFVAIVAAFLYE